MCAEDCVTSSWAAVVQTKSYFELFLLKRKAFLLTAGSKHSPLWSEYTGILRCYTIAFGNTK